MRLETARLVLAEWEPAMAAALCALSQDPENRRFLPDEVFETPEEAEAAIRRLLQYRRTGGGAQVLAVLQKDGTLVGHVELSPLEEPAGAWEAGYHIGAPYRGRGYAAEALAAFLPAMLPALGLREVFGICEASNGASCSVLERCGFRLCVQKPAVVYGRPAIMRKYRYTLPETAEKEKA